MTRVASLGLTATQISPFGQTDGAPAGANELGIVQVFVTLPAGAVLGTLVGGVFKPSAPTFSGSAAEVEAWIESLAVELQPGFDGTIPGTVRTTFTDPPADHECDDANNTFSGAADFSVMIAPAVARPVVGLTLPPGVECLAEDSALGDETNVLTVSARALGDDILS